MRENFLMLFAEPYINLQPLLYDYRPEFQSFVDYCPYLPKGI
jgi:hypothetical protein